MVKRKVVWILMIVITFFLSGCKDKPQESLLQEKEEIPAEVKQEAFVETEETQELLLVSNLDFREYLTMDKQLKGEDLLLSIQDQGMKELVGKQSLLLEAKLLMNYEDQVIEGTTLTVYDPEGRMHNESNIAGLNNIVVQLEQDGYRYSYSFLKGDTTGALQKDRIDEEDNGEEGEALQDNRLLDFYDPSYFRLIDAYMDFYQGQEVIYYEYADLYDSKSVMKTWFSLEYYMPLLEQAYYEGVLVQEMEVRRVEVNQELDESYFMLPSDVEFVEE
ncbi:MAG: hypothetical protein JW708_07630 [Vallitaleaceae bacterium]|nr:hypothetical protein [Vallitaleaceae bacterium]